MIFLMQKEVLVVIESFDNSKLNTFNYLSIINFSSIDITKQMMQSITNFREVIFTESKI